MPKSPMASPANTPAPQPDPRAIARELNHYTKPQISRSLWELAITFIPFVAVFAAMLMAVSAGYYLALALIPVAGMFLLRLFIIQHDCGHGSYFASKTWNRWLGRAIGVFTLTPYDCWQKSHALHHGNTGNLDARGFGDVDTMTKREYDALTPMGRFGYRLYRHPIVLMGLGPAYLFLLRHRLPIGLMREGAKYWICAMVTNAVTAAILIGLAMTFGAFAVAIVFLPVLLTAATVGVWLFYVQHQFEDAYWDYKGAWSFHEAAFGGSSYLVLPTPMRWFTGNIGIHHVHHLASRIPFYRLTEVLDDHPELQGYNRLGPIDAVKSMVLTLWDEDKRKLVSFKEARAAG